MMQRFGVISSKKCLFKKGYDMIAGVVRPAKGLCTNKHYFFHTMLSSFVLI